MASYQGEYSMFMFNVVWVSGLFGVGDIGWLAVCAYWVVGG